MRSPGFVLMFMPIEPAYIEAVKHNKDLFEYGYKKGIVLVSHTTLTPIPRTVSNLWMIERSNAESREISEKMTRFTTESALRLSASVAGRHAKYCQQPLQRNRQCTSWKSGSLRQCGAFQQAFSQSQ